MPPIETDGAEKCPVDHQTRQKWLDAAKAKGQSSPSHPYTASTPPPSPAVTAQQLLKAERDEKLLGELTPQILRMPQEQRNILLQQWQDLRNIDQLHLRGQTRYSLDSGRWIANVPPIQRVEPSQPVSTLPTDREISSIPRATPTNHDRPLNSAESAALPPSNSEQDTGHDRDTGNWVYPSQSQFFAAMTRKGHEPNPEDMKTIVPIHNAVNERAWSQILQWEGNRSDACGGPKLVSFAGDSKKLSPRARWWTLWGREPPFDRHDWVVERCGGRRVGYVIDFYQGRGQSGGMPLSFYLDVRPKLDSWEGMTTRVGRALGLS
jgi:cytochrome c heme-lyase